MLGGAVGSSVGRASGQTAERITSYEVDIRIEVTGDLLIEERIAYDFGSTLRHGIFRDIPVRLHFDDRYDRIYRLDVLDVNASPGTPDEYRLEDAPGGTRRIRIGDPDRTIDGRHEYVIRYRIEGALNGFPDHDELFWNAIGTEWSAPIERAVVSVEAPAGITRIACYAGPSGSRLQCGNSNLIGSTARFESGELGAYEGLTVVVAIPTGVVPTPEPLLHERWSLARAFTVNPWTVGASASLFVVLLGGIAWLLWRQGRDRRWAGSAVDLVFGSATGKVEPVGLFEGGPYPVEFAPPDDLRPGEIGTLVDEIAHPVDVTATIIDLGVRGYLEIKEIPKEGWFGKPDWRLQRLKPGEDLRAYEQTLLNGLFEDRDHVYLSDLKRKFVDRLKSVQDDLYDEVVSRGWFLRKPTTTRALWLVGGIVVLIAGGLIEAGAIRFTSLALVPLAVPLAGLVVIAAHRAMPRRTPKGTATLARIRSFRRFIETAEQERARFAERANLFYEYLPYAIVFGATDRWAKAFEGLADEATSGAGWYLSSRPLTALAFADAMDSFAVTSAGTIASTPGGSGSSGFSGGGFSGGGGGGGGGGSW